MIGHSGTLRLNEDEVISMVAPSLEEEEVADEGEDRVSFFQQSDFTKESAWATKQFTSLKHFKVRHSNAKKLAELREAQSGVDGESLERS